MARKKKEIPPVHPGEILSEEFLKHEQERSPIPKIGPSSKFSVRRIICDIVLEGSITVRKTHSEVNE
jgi:hypothetical protein